MTPQEASTAQVELLKNYATIAGGIFALLTLAKAVYEYTRQVREKRAQLFLSLRNIYAKDECFQNILNHLYGDNNFSGITLSERIEFMGFFEDLSLLISSGLLDLRMASYMFGADAVAAWNNQDFWNQNLQNDKHWSLLKAFVAEMRMFQNDFKGVESIDEISI